jgi:hypothetical protein
MLLLVVRYVYLLGEAVERRDKLFGLSEGMARIFYSTTHISAAKTMEKRRAAFSKQEARMSPHMMVVRGGTGSTGRFIAMGQGK